MKWELHRQLKDQIGTHEYSIWCDGEIVVLADIMPGEDGVLATIVDILNAANTSGNHKGDQPLTAMSNSSGIRNPNE